MIIRRLGSLPADRVVEAKTWRSRRLLLADDRVGFSMHDTILHPGTVTRMWYKNHVEAVYCIAGEGTLADLDAGETHTIAPGTLYTLNGQERHVLTATTELRMICVFRPALVGPETHDADGAYPLLEAPPAEGPAR